MGERREQILTVFGVMAVVTLFAFLVVAPRRARLAELDDQVRGLAAEVSAREQYGATIDERREALRQVDRRLVALEEWIPASEQLGDFMQRLTTASEQSELRNCSVLPESAYRTSVVEVLPIKMSFSSSFPALYAFLERVESLDRLVRVGEVRTRRDEPSSTTVETELTLQVFFQPS